MALADSQRTFIPDDSITCNHPIPDIFEITTIDSNDPMESFEISLMIGCQKQMADYISFMDCNQAVSQTFMHTDDSSCIGIFSSTRPISAYFDKHQAG